MHDEVVAIGRAAGELAFREGLRVQFTADEIRESATSGVMQTVIDGFMERDHPKLDAILGEMVRHARARIEELIAAQQASEAVQ